MLDQPTDVNQPAMAYQRDLAVGLLRYLGVTLALGAGGLFVMSFSRSPPVTGLA